MPSSSPSHRCLLPPPPLPVTTACRLTPPPGEDTAAHHLSSPLCWLPDLLPCSCPLPQLRSLPCAASAASSHADHHGRHLPRPSPPHLAASPLPLFTQDPCPSPVFTHAMAVARLHYCRSERRRRSRSRRPLLPPLRPSPTPKRRRLKLLLSSSPPQAPLPELPSMAVTTLSTIPPDLSAGGIISPFFTAGLSSSLL